ncbi:hypothetical protein D3C78_1241050 [compost metagenome]
MQDAPGLAPGTVRHDQQPPGRSARVNRGQVRDGLRHFPGEQQPGFATGQFGFQLGEPLADAQLGIGQAESGQPGCVQRVTGFVRVLQDQHPGMAG